MQHNVDAHLVTLGCTCVLILLIMLKISS